MILWSDPIGSGIGFIDLGSQTKKFRNNIHLILPNNGSEYRVCVVLT
jgi:hypothetical protein